MTNLQIKIYNFIVQNYPMCDTCISYSNGYRYNQNANNVCRKLRDLNKIKRFKGNCKKCNRNVILNISI